MITQSKSEFFRTAFNRNIGLLTPGELKTLSISRVAIAGMGGVGGVQLTTLARTGFGSFHLADFDTFELENFNRQQGARMQTIGKSKLEVCTEDALEINPHLDIVGFPEGINKECIDAFFKDVDVVVDALDFFALEAKRLLYREAYKRGIYCISAGPIGFGCSLLVFAPAPAMSAENFFRFDLAQNETEQAVLYASGLTPWTNWVADMHQEHVDLEAGRGPSLGLVCQLCGGITAMEAVKIVLGKKGIAAIPTVRRFDALRFRTYRKKLRMGNAGPLQRLKFNIIKRKFGSKQQSIRQKDLTPHLDSFTELSPEAVKQLCYYGTLAPSGDNAQHWKFLWKDNVLELWQDGKRSEFHYAQNGEPLLIAYAAAIENIAIAASALGKTIKTEVVTTLSELATFKDLLVARLTFQDAAIKTDPLLNFIPERRTTRTYYEKRALSESLTSKLLESFQGAHLSHVHLFDSSSLLPLSGQLVKKADKILWEHKNLHADLFRWLDFTDASKEGLPVSSLDLLPPEKLMMSALKNWPLVSFLNKLGLSRMTADKSYQWMKHSGAHCIITVDEISSDSIFEAGRFMQRFWITACAHGLSLQPMTSSAMMCMMYATNKGEGFTTAHKESMREITRLYKQILGSDAIPVMMFRLGYSDKRQIRAARRAIDDVFSSGDAP